jgi:TPR repeat protein
VHASAFGSMLEFDWRLAGRTRDLQQALEETRPQIVHFSGHGGSKGLVLLGADGRSPRTVDAAILRELFQKDARTIRLVVLTACHSLPQAEAIKEVVGCAIGTRDQISDNASIIFNAKFYSAIASGRSVQDAFERARTALRLEHPAEGEILELLHRNDVDPAKIILVSRFRRFARIGATVAAALVLLLAVLFIIREPRIVDPPLSGGLRLGDCTPEGTGTPTSASTEPESPSEAATLLAQAKSFCQAGNYDSAFASFDRAAAEGEPEAMSFLAIAYLSGEGTKRDTVRGMFWLDRAARKERDPRGMNALGVFYENDEGMARRYSLARHWYEEAAKQDYAEAMRNLGRHYHMGIGIARNDSLALAWYEKAVRAGSVDAMVDIGRMHEKGVSGRRDTGAALRLYRSAATAGSPLGMYSMGRVYQEAIGVRRDYAQARTWYLRGACAGSAEAMSSLGLLYQRGLGVAADRGAAIEWFRRGAEAGSSGAAANFARLERRGVGKVLGLLDRPGSGPPPGCTSPSSPAP